MQTHIVFRVDGVAHRLLQPGKKCFPYQFVESYPLTASGKVQKFVLREQAIKTLGLEEIAKIKTA